MGGKSKNPDLPNLQKYGVPFYGAAWAPHSRIRSKLLSTREDDSNQSTGDASADNSSLLPEMEAGQSYVVLAGGGGEGRSGIPNAVLLSLFDFASASLSHQPVATLGTDSELPYRMAVHPSGDGLICAFPKSCRLLEWGTLEGSEVQKLSLNASERVLSQLEDVGQQLALTFNADGSLLAVGGEDGSLRVFKWPSMDIILEESQAHVSVKDLNFSPDGKFLVSLGNRGPGRVWDIASSKVAASLAKENDEIFAFCRFCINNDGNQVLLIAAITGQGASIVTWNTSTWKRMRAKRIVREPVSSFSVSPDGKNLAIGTAEGDVVIINSTSMRVQMMVRKAHLGIITALAFSDDSRALVSASMDSSARVTLVEEKKSNGGLGLLVIIFIILLAIAVYFMKKAVIIP